MTDDVRIDAILIDGRHRNELGDIKSLAASIDDIGLVHPPVVTPDHRLVAGERRLAAVRLLGWDTVPVTYIHTLKGAADVLQAECDENTCRKDFTPTEAAGIRKAIEAVLAPVVEQDRREAIRDRQTAHNSKSKAPISDGGKLPPSEPKPRTREVAAKGTGFSGRTLDKVDAVVELAESPETPKPVRDVALQAKTEMDATGNVSKAHQKVTEAQQAHDAVTDFPDLAHYVQTGRPADAIRLAVALRGYDEPELTVRIDALRKTIAADKAGKLTPNSNNGGPDYSVLAHKMFLAANSASQMIETSGGAATLRSAIDTSDQMTISNWRAQFASLAETCAVMAAACSPKLTVIR